MMHQTKIVFQSKSTVGATYFYFTILLCWTITIYLLLHLKDNLPVIITIVCLVQMISLVTSKERITVYTDRFLLEDYRLFNILSRKKEFRFDEVKSIDAQLPLTQKGDIFSDFVGMSTNVMMIIWNKLSITYRIGKEKKVISKLYRNEFEEAFKQIKRLSDIQINVTYK